MQNIKITSEEARGNLVDAETIDISWSDSQHDVIPLYSNKSEVWIEKIIELLLSKDIFAIKIED